jgi:UDP-N-acetylmuramate-alanine ligase
MKRGIDAVEYMLNEGLPYISGPQFLADHVLQGKHVLGVAGTMVKPQPQPCWHGCSIKQV